MGFCFYLTWPRGVCVESCLLGQFLLGYFGTFVWGCAAGAEAGLVTQEPAAHWSLYGAIIKTNKQHTNWERNTIATYLSVFFARTTRSIEVVSTRLVLSLCASDPQGGVFTCKYNIFAAFRIVRRELEVF